MIPFPQDIHPSIHPIANTQKGNEKLYPILSLLYQRSEYFPQSSLLPTAKCPPNAQRMFTLSYFYKPDTEKKPPSLVSQTPAASLLLSCLEHLSLPSSCPVILIVFKHNKPALLKTHPSVSPSHISCKLISPFSSSRPSPSWGCSACARCAGVP